MLPIPDMLLADNSKYSRERIAHLVLEKPSLLPELLGCLQHFKESVQAGAADILKKIGKCAPELLSPHKPLLLDALFDASIHQTQWHLCQILVLLDINDIEFDRLYPKLLELYKSSDSRVVKAFSLTALVELSLKLDKKMKLDKKIEKSQELVCEALKSNLPSVSARARRLRQQITDCVRPTWWKS